MLKNILIALLLVIGLQTMSVVVFQVPIAHAETDEELGENLDDTTFMFDLGSITHEAIEGTTRQGWLRGGINYFFERIIGFMAAVIGSLAVLMASVGGFMIIYSGGNEETRGKGVNYVKYSLIGLAVTLLAYVMVTLVQLLISSIYA